MTSKWPFRDNNSFAEEFHRIKQHSDPGLDTSERVISIAIIILDMMAIVSNCLTIVIIISMATLRKCVSSICSVNLCTLNLLASIASLVRFFKKLLLQENAMGDSKILCYIFDFLNGFIIYAIIYCIVTINFDKFYSIKYPIHYSNTVSKSVALLIQGATTVISIVLALMPSLMSKTSHTTYCSLTYFHDQHSATYSVTVAVVSFAIPVVVTMLMNVSVYKVAKRTLTQIHATPSFMYDGFRFDNGKSFSANNDIASNNVNPDNDPRTISVNEFGSERGITNSIDQLSSLSVCTLKSNNLIYDEHVISAGSKHHRQKQLTMSMETLTIFDNLPGVVVKTDLTGRQFQHKGTHSVPRTPKLIISPVASPFLSPKTSPIAKTIQQRTEQLKSNSQKQRPKGINITRTNFKALRNLLIPFLYFILIWGPYFYAHLVHVNNTPPQSGAALLIVSGFLIHVSFVLSPFIYIGMKRNFKEEAVEFFRNFRHQPTGTDEINNDANQTFQQFLNSSTM